MSYVAGISLASLEEPLRTTLEGYIELSHGNIGLDVDAAVKLELTPDEPNSARSVTPLQYRGRAAGMLAVIAFKPGDGTGDENTYKLHDVLTGTYPRDPKIVPRSKKGIHSEAHLRLASWLVDQPNADPRLFAGNLSLLGFQDMGTRQIVKIAELGHSGELFPYVMNGIYPSGRPQPQATLTTGYLARYGIPTYHHGERFGDPHAVYNHHPEVVQVCGFVAASSVGETDALVSLHAKRPTFTAEGTTALQ